MPADAEPAAITPEALAARLLYRDGLMLILDKPAGLPVHPGPKGGPSLELLLDQLRFGLPKRPELAHRLDKDTSGCLVLGRHRQALQRLGRLFAQGLVLKTYWAVVIGAPPEGQGRIELPLARRSDDPRSWWMKVDPDGQPAVTDYRILGGFTPALVECSDDLRPVGREGAAAAPTLSWLELRPETGRTHQLRVHLAALGCPILGDRIYGLRDDPAAPPLQLHARSIRVPLYPNRAPISASAPAPAHMLAVAPGLRLRSVWLKLPGTRVRSVPGWRADEECVATDDQTSEPGRARGGPRPHPAVAPRSGRARGDRDPAGDRLA